MFLKNISGYSWLLFTYCVPWFEPLHINYSLGVDGISVVMLLLTSIIVFTGTFASWQMEPMKKEYFLWFTLLSIGVYGFFISVIYFSDAAVGESVEGLFRP